MELKIGDKAPSFKCADQNGKVRSEKDFKGAPYVIYFYPRADTPGCTTQSCALSDARKDLKKLKAEVIGVSPDTPAKQKKFDDKYKLGFTLLADEEHVVADSGWTRVRWQEAVRYGQCRSHWHANVQQRDIGSSGNGEHQRQHQYETNFVEQGKTNGEAG